MKRVLGILTAVLATCALGVSQVAPASAYPPATPLLTTTTPTTTVGASVTFRATGFVAGATISFWMSNTMVGTVVVNSSGSASMAGYSPTTPGTFTVTANTPDGRTASFSLTVLAAAPAGGFPIPATGTNSSGMSMTAGVLLLIGAGLVGAAALRRRSHALAS